MRTLIAIGGGELKTKTTLKIDEYIADLVKKRAAPNRGTALFIGTASHDSLPYFNSFRKIYTSVFDIKAEVALLTKKDVPIEHNAEKLKKTDLIYVGGGDTLYMLDIWRKTGFDKLILEAYRNGVPVAGLSAGSICLFEKMYADSAKREDGGYGIEDGLGWIPGIMTPHYNLRPEFDEIARDYPIKYAAKDNEALLFTDEKLVGKLS